MINMRHLTIEELQRLASIGTEDAVIELGRRFIDYNFRYCDRLEDCIKDLEADVQYYRRIVSDD